MVLEKYKKMRTSSSPEPAGDEKTASTRAKQKPEEGLFCVQKHLASHLHYDLRPQRGEGRRY